MGSQPSSEAGTKTHGGVAGPDATLPDGTKIGRYVVVGIAGEGGMGKVYKAFDPELDRKVALKLLKVSARESQPGEARARMLREAQALARLSHPNVVNIWDVGTHEEHVFLALELVDGITLREWIKAGGHTWRQIVDVFRPAAEGLAAAHDAALVHRDFKPLNVLIGKDGRVRVLDFGLARAAHSGEPPPPEEAATPPHAAEQSSPSLSTPLTREGAVSGTAGYIAPEVLRGRPADGRSDQFAFGVALFEALYGRKPWVEKNTTETMKAMLDGVEPQVPPGSDVPAWVQTVALTALESHPDDRYPTMRELIAALSRDPAQARTRLLGVGAAAVLITVFGAGLAGLSRQGPDCAAEEKRIAAVWSPETRASMQAAFTATGRPAAADTFARVTRTLDDWSLTWAHEATAACTAEHDAAAGNKEARVLQRICLDRRLGELKALGAVLATADKGVVDQALSAARGLPNPERCREPKLLTGAVLPIADPKLRATADRLRARLDEAYAQMVSGRFPLAMKEATELAQLAHDAKLKDVESEALALLGKVQGRSYQLQEAASSLSQALAAALEAQVEIDVFIAAVRLVHVLNLNKRAEESEHVLKIAEAMRARLGDDELLEADLLESKAGSAALGGRFEETLALRKRANVLKTKRLGEDHPETVASLINISKTLGDLGRLTESTPLMRRALAVSEQSLGSEHPALIVARCNLCYYCALEGQFAEGAKFCEEGAALAARIHGATNPMSGWCLGNLSFLGSLANDGTGAVGAGDRAVAIVEKIFTEKDLELAEARMYRARGLALAGEVEKARVEIDASLGPALANLGKDDPSFAEYLNTQGYVELAAHRAKEAVAPLEEALKSREAHGTPTERADTRFLLARALRESGQDAVRARALASQARVELEGFPAQVARREGIEKWLDANR